MICNSLHKKELRPMVINHSLSVGWASDVIVKVWSLGEFVSSISQQSTDLCHRNWTELQNPFAISTSPPCPFFSGRPTFIHKSFVFQLPLQFPIRLQLINDSHAIPGSFHDAFISDSRLPSLTKVTTATLLIVLPNLNMRTKKAISN